MSLFRSRYAAASFCRFHHSLADMHCTCRSCVKFEAGDWLWCGLSMLETNLGTYKVALVTRVQRPDMHACT